MTVGDCPDHRTLETRTVILAGDGSCCYDTNLLMRWTAHRRHAAHYDSTAVAMAGLLRCCDLDDSLFVAAGICGLLLLLLVLS